MTQQEVIKAFMKSFDTTTLKGEAALDAAIKACSTFNSFDELKTAIINDCKNAKSADDFLNTYCGINLDNDDTGAITGSDAGGSTVKTATSIVPEEGSLYEFDKGNWFNDVEGQDGLIIKLGKRTGSLKDSLNNVVERDFSELFNDELSNKQEIYLWRSVYKWWIRNGLALISESYGNNFSFDKENSSATNKDRTIYIIFEYFEDSDALADTWGGPVHNQKSTNNLVIRINLKYYDKATGKDGAVINGQEYLDRTIAHELTHAVMRANIDYFDYLPALIKEGVAELTHGIDDVRTNDIKILANNSNLLAKALVLDENPVTLSGSGIGNPSYSAGYMFLRYLTRQAGDLTIENSSDSIVRTFRGNDKIKNYSDGVTITSGNGNDLISNDHSNKVTMLGGAGNDTLWNWSTDSTKATGANVSMDGGAGNDTIWNGGNYATIVGGTGNDSIYNGGSYVLFKYSSGDGNDLITGFKANSTLQIGNGTGSYSTTKSSDGKDIIVTVGNGKISLMGAASLSALNIIGDNPLNIIGTASADSISNTLNGATIQALGGNDSVYNSGANTSINLGDGNDSVSSRGNKVTLIGGTGKDTLFINNGYESILADGGAGNDSIRNFDNNSTLLGGEGDDVIGNYEKGYINGTLVAEGVGKNVTIEGGKGNDSIDNSGANVLFKYAAGDGNDTITGFKANSTLQIGNGTGSYSTTKSSDGKDIIVTVGNGKITLLGAASLSSVNIKGTHIGDNPLNIIGTASADSISNTLNGATIQALGSNDSVYNSGANTSIDAGNGNDLISNNHSNKVTMLGGAGDDTLWNWSTDSTKATGANVSMDGGAGNDTIWNGGNYATIDAGTGNDTLENYGNNSNINGNVGNDIVYNYATNVKADGGGDNDLISNNHSNKVTMLGGAGDDTLWNWSTDSTKATGANVSMDGGAGNDTIWNGGNYATIVGGTGNDSIYNGGSYVLFKYSSGDGNDKIYNWSANDTISITGGKYSRSTVGSDVVLTVGSGKITLVGANGKTLNIKGTRDSGNVGATINNTLASKFLTGTSYADSIKNTGSKVTISTATGNDTINNNLGHDTSVNAGAGNDSIYNYSDRATILGGDGNDTLTNITWQSYIDGGSGNDRISLSGGYYYNTVVGGMGDDTIYGDTAPQTFKYAQGDGNDKIYNWSANDTISITGGKYSRSSVGNDVVLTVGTGKITLVGANGKTLNIVGEYDPTRLILTNSSKAAVTLATAYDIGDASSRTKTIKIVGNAKDNSILGGSKNDTLYGADGDDYLVGNAGNDKLYGQDDDDTLWGGAGNNTLIGGDGDDLFIHSAGKDLIYDYAAGDRISLGSAISKATLSGSNVVLTTGNGTLTVKGGKNKTLSLITSTGKELSTIIGSDKVTYTDSSAAKVTLSSTYTTADATARTKAIRIVGNAKDNTILGGTGKDTLYGGDGDDYLEGNEGADKFYGQDGDDTLYGGAGNDSLYGGDGDDYLEGNEGSDKLYGQDGDNTLVGGAGNDSLWGGDGSDMFLYDAGDGKDVIFGFDDDDMLEISDKFSAKYYASSDKIVFKVGSTASAITIKDFTADTFNINGDTYKISGSKLVKK